MRCRYWVFMCFVCLLAYGCSRTLDRDADWLEQGKHFLFGIVSEEVPSGIYMPSAEWNQEAEEVRFDEERFPNWARGLYSACVYWKGEYSRRELNQSRSPGEPTQWELQGTAWGWILVGDSAPHVLQLIIRDKGEEIVVVEAWNAPDDGT